MGKKIAMAEPASEHLVERIFDRMEALRLELGGKIDAVSTELTRQATRWNVFRPLLEGNGKPAIDVRVDRLEGVVGRIRWGLTAVVAPLVVYACYALFEKYLKLP